MPHACPRVCSAAALAAFAALCAAPREARALDHEAYFLAGGGYYGGVSRVAVGLGPGVGYRLHVVAGLSAHVEQRWLLYGGNAFTTTVGAMYALQLGPWAPAAGLQFTAYYGDLIRVVDGANPGLEPVFNVGLQLRLAPVRFRSGRFTAAALVFDYGYSIERGALANAIAVSFLEIGMRF